MKIGFKHVIIGDYVYHSYGENYMICKIISMKSKFGPDYILSTVLESSDNHGTKEFNYCEQDNAEYYSNRSDIDKILVFK